MRKLWHSRLLVARNESLDVNGLFSVVAGGLNHEVLGPIGVRWIPGVESLHYDYVS